jgi:hypothetical protein
MVLIGPPVVDADKIYTCQSQICGRRFLLGYDSQLGLGSMQDHHRKLILQISR